MSKIKASINSSEISNHPKTHRKVESTGNALKQIDGIKNMINNYVI
jgi:hypothetical protein